METSVCLSIHDSKIKWNKIPLAGDEEGFQRPGDVALRDMGLGWGVTGLEDPLNDSVLFSVPRVGYW